ncbi:MAG: hypothetical protein E7672_09415 [Ruminococcaceae bacterium]|nr:hypothetical protein [Oscillospiraceae bacterium]
MIRITDRKSSIIPTGYVSLGINIEPFFISAVAHPTEIPCQAHTRTDTALFTIVNEETKIKRREIVVDISSQIE